jgi:hypothetical protein
VRDISGIEHTSELQELRRLAEAFRNAIESARDAFPSSLRADFRAFPKRACDHASILLGLYLQEHGFPEIQYVYAGTRGPKPEDSHAWLEVDSIIVDITASQFPDKQDLVIVTEDHSWHRQFAGQLCVRISLALDDVKGELKQDYIAAFDEIRKWLPSG